MASRTRRRASNLGRGIVLVALLGIAPLLVSAADTPAPASRVPRPSVDAGEGGKCVADTEFMRRNHMKLLLHQRDETVHAGVRPRNTSLEACISCHASKKTGSVIGSDQNFCQGCHAYAAVQIDCFECHASKPEAARAAADRGRLVGVTP
jgi:hypothetical protein